MKGVWLTALQTEAQRIHRTGAVYTVAVKKKTLACKLGHVSVHIGNEKYMLAGRKGEKKPLLTKLVCCCDVKPDSFCHLERFSIGFLWVDDNLIHFVLGVIIVSFPHCYMEGSHLKSPSLDLLFLSTVKVTRAI